MADIVGVLLAAGSSTRYGSNKLIAEISDQPMIHHSAAALTPCDRIIAVVRADDDALITVLDGLDVDPVLNHEPERGMGYSIACAIHASIDSSGWCLLPADMPRVQTATTKRLISALQTGSAMAAPFYNGRRGHPVAFSDQFRDALAALDGESGARGTVERDADQLTVVDCDDAGVLVDIDTPGELGRLKTI